MATGGEGGGGGVAARLKENARSYLLVGGSGTGKTSFLCRLAKAHAKKPLYLIGGDPKDYTGLTCQQRELDKTLTEVKSSVVLLDDLFSIKKSADSENLRSLLCKTKRHNKVVVGVSVHTLEHTGMRGALLDHFDVVVFTRPKQADDRNTQLFLKRVGGSTDWLNEDHFSSVPEFGYLWVDVRRQEALLIDRDGRWMDGCGGVADSGCSGRPGEAAKKEALARRRETLRKDIVKILKVFPDVDMLATCHLDYILRNLPADQISTTDFTFTLKSVSSEKKMSDTAKVSLLDYLVACQRPHSKVTKDQKRLKKYLDSRFHTPQTLILNPALK